MHCCSKATKLRLKDGSVPTEKIPKTKLELSGIIKAKKPKERSQRLKNAMSINISNTVEITTSTEDAVSVSNSNDGEFSAPNIDLPSENCNDLDYRADSQQSIERNSKPHSLFVMIATVMFVSISASISCNVDVLPQIERNSTMDVNESCLLIDSNNKPGTCNKAITVRLNGFFERHSNDFVF